MEEEDGGHRSCTVGERHSGVWQLVGFRCGGRRRWPIGDGGGAVFRRIGPMVTGDGSGGHGERIVLQADGSDGFTVVFYFYFIISCNIFIGCV